MPEYTKAKGRSALRGAQLEMARDQQWSKPYYWEALSLGELELAADLNFLGGFLQETIFDGCVVSVERLAQLFNC